MLLQLEPSGESLQPGIKTHHQPVRRKIPQLATVQVSARTSDMTVALQPGQVRATRRRSTMDGLLGQHGELKEGRDVTGGGTQGGRLKWVVTRFSVLTRLPGAGVTGETRGTRIGWSWRVGDGGWSKAGRWRSTMDGLLDQHREFKEMGMLLEVAVEEAD